jgi:hypothetical protein
VGSISRRVLHPSTRDIAQGLAIIPGLLGILGLGHLYVGLKRRAVPFLIVTAALGVGALVSFTAPALAPSFIIDPVLFPVGWALAWLAGVYDIRKVTRVTPLSQGGPAVSAVPNP